MAISMLKIRRPLGRLIFNMGIAIPGKTVFLIETAPRLQASDFLGRVAHPHEWDFIHHMIPAVAHMSSVINHDTDDRDLFVDVPSQ